MSSKIGKLCLGLLFLALTACAGTPTVAPETPSGPSPSSPKATLTVAPPTPIPATLTPTLTSPTTTPEGPPQPTLEPVQPPVAAAAPVPGPLTITEIQMVDLTNGWALGRGSHPVDQVLRTADGGLTWRLASPPEPVPDSPEAAKLGRFLAIDPDQVWITYQFEKVFQIPSAARVWMTGDGGETWQASRRLPIPGEFEFYNLTDFQQSRDGSGWFIAHIGAGMNHDYIALFRGSQDGIDWARVVDPFQTPFIQGCQKTGLDFLGGDYGWLGVDCQGVREGALYHETQDGGLTWEAKEISPPPQAEDLFERAFCGVYDPILISEDEGIFLLRCLLGDFETREDFQYWTSNGGESWEVSSFPGGRLAVLSENSAWALSRDLYQSSDGGTSWTLIKSVNWDGQFSFVDPLNGWAVAQSEDASALVRTDDGGQTWRIIEPQIINLAP